MSVFSEAVAAVQSVLKLSDELRRTSQELKDVAVELRDHDRRITRLRTGMPEFDACLGGGLVPGSLVLLGGPPGAGKSTLLLQIAERLAEAGAAAVYVCG